MSPNRPARADSSAASTPVPISSPQLADLCRAHDVRAGALRATGSVADATVGARRLDGNVEIVTLNGAPRRGRRRWAALATAAGELVGGRLVAARVVACDFVVDTFDDLPAPSRRRPSRRPRAPRGATSSPPAGGRKSDPPPAPAVRPGLELRHAPPTTPQPPPAEPINVRPGDFIDHPKFGRCAVERVDGDYEFVTARLRNQRLIRLSLDVLTLIHAGEEDGKNVFRAVAGA